MYAAPIPYRCKRGRKNGAQHARQARVSKLGFHASAVVSDPMNPARPAGAAARAWQRLGQWAGARRSRTICLLAALAVIALGGALTATVLLRDRATELEQARRDLRAISLPAAMFLEHGLGTLDLIVSQAVAGFGRGELDLAGVDRWLRSQADQLNALDQLLLVDSKGVVRYAARADRIGADVSDREYFRRHLRDATSGMVVEAPLVTRFPPHRRIVPVSWAIRTSTGELAGVIVTSANWGLYADAFTALLNRPNQAVALIDRQGRLYALDSAHWPNADVEPERPPFLALDWLSDPSASVAGYLVGYAEVPGFDLQIVSGIPTASILSAWWRRVEVVAGLLLLTAAGVGWLSAQLHHKVRTLRTTAQAARAAQQRAEASEGAKGQFLAAMSHEIRTPMTGVLGMADLLATAPLPPAQQTQVEAIQASGRHLLSVINDILDFSRIDAGGLMLEQIDFALVPLLEEVQSIMAAQAAKRELVLTVDVQDGIPPALRGDPTRLRQILVNLIGNGLKFTHRGGVDVRVRGRPETSQGVLLRVEVEDTGIGIPAERQAELFHPFMQVNPSTTRDYGGTGLGLAISRELVGLMGGQIGVTSEPGKGSLFWFELSLPVGDAATLVPALPPTLGVTPSLRLLVAEDVPLNRDLLQAGLAQAGHDVVLVGDGAEAVARASAQRFDAVLMDVHMPVMDGIEAARRIRALPPPRGSVPIMALTASVMTSERQHCLDAGMTKVLAKPIVWSHLLAALTDLPAGGAAPAADAKATMPGPPAGFVDASLPDIDRNVIDGLARQLPPAALQRMLRQGLDGATQSCVRLRAAVGDPDRLRQEAHRLRGTSGSFGLARISALAGALEDRAAQGEIVMELVSELERAAAAAQRSSLASPSLMSVR